MIAWTVLLNQDDADAPAKPHGSPHWIIESVGLLSTTARLTGTSEVATFSNGSIARSRIINMNRSPDPLIYVYVRFETNVPYSTILIFKAAVQKFIEDRPQEWADMVGFRNSRIEPQENFVEYVVVLQHRLSWQNLGSVLESKGAAQTFCVELLNQMGLHYTAPPKPIQIRIGNEGKDEEMNGSREDEKEEEKQGVEGEDVPRSSPVAQLQRMVQQLGSMDTTENTSP